MHLVSVREFQVSKLISFQKIDDVGPSERPKEIRKKEEKKNRSKRRKRGNYLGKERQVEIKSEERKTQKKNK